MNMIRLLVASSLLTGVLSTKYPRNPELTYETFRTPAVPLRSGQIANTDPRQYSIPFVEGPVAVRHFTFRIVDDDNNTVPTTEIYSHHWSIYNGTSGDGGFCKTLDHIWGVSTEKVDYYYNAPYAIVTNGNEKWNANLHFIRTTNVPNVQDCIECRCPSSDPPLHPHGTIYCCGDGTQCYSMENSTLYDTKNYYLEYTVGYSPITKDTIPLTVFVMDITATHGTDCNIHYDIPALGPNETSIKNSSFILPGNWNISYVYLHLHIGGEQFIFDHYRNGSLVSNICTASPFYEMEGPEEGHITGTELCLFPGDSPYQVFRGDEVRMTTIYSGRTLPGGNPWHAGVMGLAFIHAQADGFSDPKSACNGQLDSVCALTTSEEDCFQCAKSAAILTDVCSSQQINEKCSSKDNRNRIQVEDVEMALTVTPTQRETLIVNFTCPHGTWCGIGANPSRPYMKDTKSFVYIPGEPTLREAVMKYRDPGTARDTLETPWAQNMVIHDADGQVSVSFEAALDMFAKNSCILYAHGVPGKKVLGYHGATRGATCLGLTNHTEISQHDA